MNTLFSKEIQNDLQRYLDEHLKMQLMSFNLSAESDRLGYPGFAHYFQVQAQDEILHQRRIINFILDRNGTYCFKNSTVEYKKCNSILEVMEEHHKQRKYFTDLTNELATNAKAQNDLVTYKFYDWFIIDFYEEWAEIKDIIDWIKMSNANYYKLDRKLLKREEPNTEAVIDPFSYHD